MKTLLLLLLLCTSAFGQTWYVRTNDNTLAVAFPTTFTLPGGATVTGAGLLDAAKWLGWRQVEAWQPVTNGWAVDSWTNSTATNGYPKATMLIAAQHNIAVAVDQSWTNNPNWATLASEAHSYSNLVWLYAPAHYVGSLTNFVNTPQVIMSYYTQLTRTNSSVNASNAVDFMYAITLLSDIINSAGNSTNFPWRLVP